METPDGGSQQMNYDAFGQVTLDTFDRMGQGDNWLRLFVIYKIGVTI
jgi:hypothetical protein